MASNATITAKTGAGQQATTLLLTNIRDFAFNCENNTLAVTCQNGEVKYFAGYSTITVTVSGGNYTLTVT